MTRVSSKEKRDRQLLIRLTSEEMDLISKISESRDLGKSTLVRKIAINAIRKAMRQ